jgi:hypothetical protein
MPSPSFHDQKTVPIARPSPDFFPALAHAEFDEVWAWAEETVAAKGGAQLSDAPRPAILDRLERRGFSPVRVLAAVMWLKGALKAQRTESSAAP